MQVAEIFAYLCTQYGEKRGKAEAEEEERGGRGRGAEGKRDCFVLLCFVLFSFCCCCNCVHIVLSFLSVYLFGLVWFGLVWLFLCLFVCLSFSLFVFSPSSCFNFYVFSIFFLYKEQSGQKIVIIRRCQNMPPFDVLLNNLHRRPVVWLFVCSFFLFPSFSVFLFFFFFFFFFWYLIYTYSVFLHLDPACSSFILLIYFTCLACLDFVYVFCVCVCVCFSCSFD